MNPRRKISRQKLRRTRLINDNNRAHVSSIVELIHRLVLFRLSVDQTYIDPAYVSKYLFVNLPIY